MAKLNFELVGPGSFLAAPCKFSLLRLFLGRSFWMAAVGSSNPPICQQATPSSSRAPAPRQRQRAQIRAAVAIEGRTP